MSEKYLCALSLVWSLHVCVCEANRSVTILSAAHRKQMKRWVQLWLFLGCHSKTAVFPTSGFHLLGK